MGMSAENIPGLGSKPVATMAGEPPAERGGPQMTRWPFAGERDSEGEGCGRARGRCRCRSREAWRSDLFRRAGQGHLGGRLVPVELTAAAAFLLLVGLIFTVGIGVIPGATGVNRWLAGFEGGRKGATTHRVGHHQRQDHGKGFCDHLLPIPLGRQALAVKFSFRQWLRSKRFSKVGASHPGGIVL